MGPRSEENDNAQVRTIFISYSHRDEQHKNELQAHLAPLLMLKKIRTWDDRMLRAGQPLYQEIRENIQSADIFLMLISSDYLNSRSCQDEMQLALNRMKEENSISIPIIVRPCDWTVLPLNDILSVPRDAKPVSKWDDKDEAWTSVAKSIRELLDDWQIDKETSEAENQGAVANLPDAVADQLAISTLSDGGPPQQWINRKEGNDAEWDAVKDSLLTAFSTPEKSSSRSRVRCDNARWWGNKLILDAWLPQFERSRRFFLEDIGGTPGYPGYQLFFYTQDWKLPLDEERVRWLSASDGNKAFLRLRPKEDSKLYSPEDYADHIWGKISALAEETSVLPAANPKRIGRRPRE